MPKKLTVIGVLAAMVMGVLAVFHGSATATPPPIQSFPDTGAFAVNSGTCWYDGTGTAGHPVLGGGGHVECGPNTSETNVPASATAVESFTYIELVAGNRLTLPITYTPSGVGEFGQDTAVTSCGAVDADDGDGRCTNLTITGRVTAQPDLLCSGTPYDVLAEAKVGAVPPPWPNDPSDGIGWQGFPFRRSEEAASGTGEPSNDSTFLLADNAFLPADADTLADDLRFTQNLYVNDTKPFPDSFTFVSLDTASLERLFLGGAGTGLVITPAPLQLYTATMPYGPGTINASVALLGGNPENPPQNDYLCLDSPQHSETNVSYVIPPTANILYPRWVTFITAKDFVSGDINRTIDVQCVGVGTVSSGPGLTDIGLGIETDEDDDCLATPTDLDDSDADQDNDGLLDGVEAMYGTSLVSNGVADDGASDFVEMLQFTDPGDPDTDNDGSADLADNQGDEDTVTPLYNDTIIDDNCPAIANVDQLNTDSTGAYKGGVTALNNINPGGSASYIDPVGPPVPLAYGPVTATLAGTTMTVSTTTAHRYINGALVDISGITGRTGGTATDNNNYVTYLNNSRAVVAGVTAGTSQTTFTVTGLLAGMTAGTATGTIVVRPSTGDVTQPDADVLGDECDTDDDNDGIGDVAEPLVLIVDWTGFAGANTTVCVGPSDPDITKVAPAVPLNTKNGDTDRDLILDGEECRQSSRPDVSNPANTAPHSTASCDSAGIDPDGCSQPKGPAAGCDPDGLIAPFGDGLYFVGCAGAHAGVELFYHTLGINQHAPAGQVNDIDGDGDNGDDDKDADADWNFIAVGVPAPSVDSFLQDGPEVRGWGTDPSSPDTDNDGCDDAREAFDIDGNRTIVPGDQAILNNRLIVTVVGGNLDSGTNGDPTAGDRSVNAWGVNFDLNKDRSITPGDQAFLSGIIAKGGACAFNRAQGQPVTNNDRGPFDPF